MSVVQSCTTSIFSDNRRFGLFPCAIAMLSMVFNTDDANDRKHMCFLTHPNPKGKPQLKHIPQYLNINIT